MEDYSVNKVLAKTKSPKEALRGKVTKKASKAYSPPKPHNFKDEAWYGLAWEKFSVSKRQSEYRLERAGRTDGGFVR